MVVEVDRALAESAAWLRARQAADGHFDGTTWQSAASTAQVVIVEALLGALRPDDAALTVRFFETHVRDDGSFPAYHGATFGTLADAAQVEAALACCGLAEDAPLRMRVHGFVEAHGGRRAADPITQIFLALAKLLPVGELPAASVLHVLIPGVDAWMGRTFMPYYSTILGYLVPGLLDALAPAAPSRLTAHARRRIVAYFVERQNPEGSWAGGQWVSCMALALLHLLGVGADHPAIARGLAFLATTKQRGVDGLRVMPFNADVWNTAMALRALTVAELPLARAAHAAAIDYLLSAQCRTGAPRDWANLARGQVADGGWSFSSGNPLLSDTDTTAIVMWTLRAHQAAEPRIAPALQAARRWLLGMQNADGGFAAFARGQRGKAAGPLFRTVVGPPDGVVAKLRFVARPPLELVDHATADLTGRVLGALADDTAHGSTMVRNAIAFLDAQREGDRWWGRWTTNYIASTAFILHGLHAVGANLDAEPYRRVRAWLAGCQNADGGFGERNESYANPGLAGRGPSNAYVTGLVLQHLCSVGEARSRTAERAVDYLLGSQTDDGTWVEAQAVQTLIPPEIFYTNQVNFHTAPIEALGRWRRAVRP